MAGKYEIDLFFVTSKQNKNEGEKKLMTQKLAENPIASLASPNKGVASKRGGTLLWKHVGDGWRYFSSFDGSKRKIASP